MTDLASALAEAAWQRLRSLALATAKYENLVPLNQAIDGKSAAKEQVIEKNVTEQDNKSLALQFLLMTLTSAVDAHNYMILRELANSSGGQSAQALASATGQPELGIRERISLLVQAGLLKRDFDANKILLSAPGEIVVEMLEKAVGELEETIHENLPDIFGSRAGGGR